MLRLKSNAHGGLLMLHASTKYSLYAWLWLSAGFASTSARGDSTGTPLPGELSRSTAKAGHGMVVFGQQSVYFYHLPMWHGVHAWQIVLEVELDATGAALYAGERSAASRLTTFEPQAFALATLAPGTSLHGTLYHGHFEQGGTPLPRGHSTIVSATVRRLIVVNPLNPGSSAQAAPLYRVFGQGQDWYAAHIAAGAPAFDQVVAIAAAPQSIPSQQLRAGIGISLPGVDTSAQARPQPGGHTRAVLEGGREMIFTVEKESYFSEDDLGSNYF